MKVRVVSKSQAEFDGKRIELAKKIAGDDCEVIQKSGGLPKAPRMPKYKAFKEMSDYWDKKFKETLSDIKRDIDEILEGKPRD